MSTAQKVHIVSRLSLVEDSFFNFDKAYLQMSYDKHNNIIIEFKAILIFYDIPKFMIDYLILN